MDFEEYQKLSRKTAIYPNIGKNFVYPTLGLAGETGEVVEKVKKVLRDSNGQMTQEKAEELKKELGDVLWYMAQIASELNISLDEIAIKNIEKVKSRMDRGKLTGSGDNR